MGLVNRVVEVADLETETMKLASRLAAGSARSHAHTKSLINNSLLATLDEQLIAEERHVVDCLSSADFTEGVKTFCAGRRPRFTGPDCQEG
jgi:2-(1,2-epoxy-1,2-dihydrophenyl)acetyl-CoA isomerase